MEVLQIRGAIDPGGANRPRSAVENPSTGLHGNAAGEGGNINLKGASNTGKFDTSRHRFPNPGQHHVEQKVFTGEIAPR
jgi:hypothetical protein